MMANTEQDILKDSHVFQTQAESLKSRFWHMDTFGF